MKSGKWRGLDPLQYLMQSSHSQHFTLRPQASPEGQGCAWTFPTQSDSGVSPQRVHIAFI